MKTRRCIDAFWNQNFGRTPACGSHSRALLFRGRQSVHTNSSRLRQSSSILRPYYAEKVFLTSRCKSYITVLLWCHVKTAWKCLPASYTCNGPYVLLKIIRLNTLMSSFRNVMKNISEIDVGDAWYFIQCISCEWTSRANFWKFCWIKFWTVHETVTLIFIYIKSVRMNR